MPIISSYILNNEPEGSDIIIGTDVSNGQTKNFSVNALSNAAINLWLRKISWKFVTQDPSPEPTEEGTIFFPSYGGAGSAWSTITSLYINTNMVSASNALPYLQRLIGKKIILEDRKDIARYGVYELTALTQVGSSSVYDMSLSFIEGNGVFTALQYYSIQMDAVENADKNYVHVQNVAAITWTVNHNLDKFASATMVLSTGQKGYGDIVYIDENTLTITFAGAETGKAYIN